MPEKKRKGWDRLGNDLSKMIQEQIGVPESIVEVGVCKGETSAVLVQKFPKCKLHLVDPWKSWDETDVFWKDRRLGKLDQDKWDDFYRQAMEAVGYPGNPNVKVYRMLSEAASLLIDKADVVFIDANHDYEYVKEDIALWLPKTTKLICGHDYGSKARGVKQAVDEAFAPNEIITGPNLLWAVNLDDCGCADKHKKQR